MAPPEADQDILRNSPETGDAPNPAVRPVTDDGPWRMTPAAVDAAVVEVAAGVGDGFGCVAVGCGATGVGSWVTAACCAACVAAWPGEGTVAAAVCAGRGAVAAACETCAGRVCDCVARAPATSLTAGGAALRTAGPPIHRDTARPWRRSCGRRCARSSPPARLCSPPNPTQSARARASCRSRSCVRRSRSNTRCQAGLP